MKKITKEQVLRKLEKKESLEDLDFGEMDFFNVNLKFVVFKNCDLSKVHFLKCDMTFTIFYDCNMNGARIVKCDASYSTFYMGTTLKESYIVESNLSGSRFLDNIDLTTATIARNNTFDIELPAKTFFIEGLGYTVSILNGKVIQYKEIRRPLKEFLNDSTIDRNFIDLVKAIYLL